MVRLSELAAVLLVHSHHSRSGLLYREETWLLGPKAQQNWENEIQVTEN